MTPKIAEAPPRGGWAQGKYVCKCRICKEQFMGDKRATWCADCAYSATVNTTGAHTMKRYSIEWSGIITRDIGWDELEANSPDEAREKYLKDHGQFRRVRGVIEITDMPAARFVPREA